ncbi:hypothetical protein C5E08_03280 [Rathayibacter iranicus]|uniref:Uncharacterized protein n=2 Tax=Rathayibacter iranicus TaxID=59737 RepID=A0AAD1AF42_9MICO|nr:hypothetical protein C7V51_03275 [Rathayibacter iranicus]PPI62400.1 hypothetical protein C5E08_03280 [Rathayibacter iranicus]PWJ60811.1 hypothetical protein B0H03_12410 [Rathayibacter iranicus NCPPB 2253 = VKM Ac-1602]
MTSSKNGIRVRVYGLLGKPRCSDGSTCYRSESHGPARKAKARSLGCRGRRTTENPFVHDGRPHITDEVRELRPSRDVERGRCRPP